MARPRAIARPRRQCASCLAGCDLARLWSGLLRCGTVGWPRGPTGPSRARRRVSLLRARRVARGALPWTTGTSSQPPVAPFYTAAVAHFTPPLTTEQCHQHVERSRRPAKGAGVVRKAFCFQWVLDSPHLGVDGLRPTLAPAGSRSHDGEPRGTLAGYRRYSALAPRRDMMRMPVRPLVTGGFRS